MPKGESDPLSEEKKAQLLHQIEKWASEGLRTLTLTYTVAKESDHEEINKNLTLVGIVGIEDPLRPEVPGSVQTCQKAGIFVRMLTGDNILTASSIARRCGILSEGGIAMEGPKFRSLSDGELLAILPKLQVLARCSPEDKLKLVRALRDQGEVVAVTGDGTNDAPQLREADVGFAMGISGTEVAKEACDIILLDDNFKSIEKAVMWGRNVYDSIRKFLQFQLTVNVVAICVAFIGAIDDGESPLTAVQLLWVNLLMDTLAALALATEAPTEELLNRMPYGRFSSLITPSMWRTIGGGAVYQLTILLFTLFGAANVGWLHIPAGEEGKPVVHTIVFNTFVFCQVFNEVNCRKLHNELNVFQHLSKNYIFMGVIVFSVVIQAILVEFCGGFAQTVPLSGNQWVFCLILASGTLPWGILLRLIPVPEEKLVKKKAKSFKELEEGGEAIEMEGVPLLSHNVTESVEKEGVATTESTHAPLLNTPGSSERARANWKKARSVMIQHRVIKNWTFVSSLRRTGPHVHRDMGGGLFLGVEKNT